MIYIKESIDTFNSHYKEPQNIKDGDILQSDYLNTLPGTSSSDDVVMVIDNSIPINHYLIIDEDMNEELKEYK